MVVEVIIGDLVVSICALVMPRADALEVFRTYSTLVKVTLK